MSSRHYVPSAVGFERMNRQSLDKYEVFNSIADLKKYAAKGPAYSGQRCYVNFPDGVILEYCISEVNGSYIVVPIYSMEIYYMTESSSNDYSKYGYTTDLVEVPNPSDSTVQKWLLLYDYDASRKWTFNSRCGYQTAIQAFSLLHNLELYDNGNGINFLLAANGIVKYKWKQNINFMISDRTDDTGANINISNGDSDYLCPLAIDNALTGFGVFPKKPTTNYVSLYVGL